MTRRVKLIVAYLGGPFRGWQRQAVGPTVQGEIEAALSELTGGPHIQVVGAGRTDAGVHARAQVAHADLPAAMPLDALQRGLNARLPETIRVRRVHRAGAAFHARFCARGKRYVYRVRWSDNLLPWRALRSAKMHSMARLDAFAEAAALLPGCRDMASFTVPGEAAERGVARTLLRVAWHPTVDGLQLEFVGDGFLRYQVRRMVGALFQVGWGRLAVSDFRRLLEVPRAGAAVLTAPASGLSLEQVYYRPGGAWPGTPPRPVKRGAVVDSEAGADDTKR